MAKARKGDIRTNHPYTVEEVAVLLGYTREGVRNALRRGTIPGKKIGKRWFVIFERMPMAISRIGAAQIG